MLYYMLDIQLFLQPQQKYRTEYNNASVLKANPSALECTLQKTVCITAPATGV
jgi:hypothetical protein